MNGMPETLQMKVGVVGLWHLGTVTAACMAAAGFTVVAYDENERTVTALSEARLAVLEPGLEKVVRAELASRRLCFTTKPEDLAAADVVWITYDTPVDDDDRADVEFVIRRVTDLFPLLSPRVLILISSQLPVGSTRRLEQAYREACPNGRAVFGYCPENVRIGAAIKTFTEPDRIVVGVRNGEDRKRFEPLLRAITDRIEWMGIESAEMTKHALNAFLATSITFMNELAELCHGEGADALEVERGLKTDGRIGPRAYLHPGSSFAGGTLARDIAYIESIGKRLERPTPLLSNVRTSNDDHKRWPHRRLVEVLGTLRGKRIAVLGLTYKVGTDTLRRSSALELCRWLLGEGAQVTAFDPVIESLPAGEGDGIKLGHSPQDVLQGAAAAVVATEWPVLLRIQAADLIAWMSPPPTIIDAGRFLENSLGRNERIRYLAVGV